KRQELIGLLPEVKCVEMEGAAVAQVCVEFNLPFTVIRIISDKADHDARVDFGKFIHFVANVYSKSIIVELTQKIATNIAAM
ncbi:MAG: 5'-methylthioadenosine/S-adenosylhomocysteine nucleosidase, partial [Bacteroidales bacterium]|nr:5'-methylthioadenosine/S-adenosylhomocysteine nucleosidase [Bacteroidales bacterium]